MKTNTLRSRHTIVWIIGTAILAIILLSSCEKESIIYNSSLDKKITFTILDDHYGYGSGFDTTLYSSSVINFNKSDYLIIDSILFMISDLKTKSTLDGSDIAKTISVELFDLTNNICIHNSKIITDDVNASGFKSSENLIDSFPDSPINLGIRVINNDINYCSWELHAASLVLVRK